MLDCVLLAGFWGIQGGRDLSSSKQESSDKISIQCTNVFGILELMSHEVSLIIRSKMRSAICTRVLFCVDLWCGFMSLCS